MYDYEFVFVIWDFWEFQVLYGCVYVCVPWHGVAM